ncbi:lytic transglycosylase domain-containing protein [Phreatobacter stygius]|uniref:Lytic transglycosylase domain-containing protein n=1 Tax=Phreatobacter stygius TaxID=1940610 RepID=A0A4D7BI11_9HYPH|nr:lytic transglycosylase domain-containing protein [Phreatobacter stygius]QCI67492.1 lytic transglycosylase domain-containing protein [Phreatobacter stygius]
MPLNSRRFTCGAVGLALWLAGGLFALAPGRALAQAPDGETLEQTLCRLIETGARRQGLPVHFFTRLIWAESSFRIGAVSPAGAQGVAQFMPGTARERGLADPFDPEQAIAASAALLADHVKQFGNLGLAAAAYNGGPTRVANFLEGRGGLPAETQDYVYRITGRTAQDWAEEIRRGTPPAGIAHDLPPQTCPQVTAQLRRPGGILAAVEGPFAPWGVQLAGHFSKAIALASYGRARQRLAGILGDVQPMILGSRLRSRGSSPFYRVRVPSPTRRAADVLCDRIRAAGGACIVLRNGGRT